MNVRPTRTFVYFLCFIATSFLLNLSCNKEDEYALLDAVLNKEVTPENEENVPIQLSQTEDDEEEGIDIKEEIEGIDIREDFESRTTTFSPIHDAYLQNGRGYNQPIVRLQEDRRTSYLMFDLSQIDSIGGLITDARLEFVINQDDGNGKIQVFKGATNNWTETSLTETTAPEIGGTLGEIQQEYQVNRKISIHLNATEILPEYATLILNHYDGDDLAFASKENRNRDGSRLIVTYQAPITSDVIVTDTEQDNDNDVGDEENTEEDTTEEETAVEESTTEESVEEDTKEEETTTEESGEEDTTEEESTAEEGVEEDTKEEESTTEEGVEEDTKEEETTTEESVAEDATEEETTEDEVNEEGNSEEETTKDQTTDEETITVETTDGEVNEEGTTEEEPTKEETTEEETAEEETNGGGNTTEETAEDGTVEEETTEEETTQEETIEEETNGQESNGETPDTNQPENPGPVSPANSAPITVAEATPSSGPVPLKVTFTGSNSSDDKEITRYAWNFKDGSTASTANTVHTFTEVGTYEVALTTTDEEGLNSSKTITITVEEKSNAAPVAKASADKSSGTAPFEVSFKGGDSTDDNPVKGYFWDFKDGSTSSENDPSHVFTEPGTYQVELTVTDENGLTDKDSVTITVEELVNEAPAAEATASVVEGEAPLEVDFIGSGSTDDKGVMAYSWDFGSDSSPDPNPTYTFNDPGVYDVSLTVTDDEGLQDTSTLRVTVDPKIADPVVVGNLPCGTGTGFANETGAKVWCWSDIAITEDNDRDSNALHGGQLYTNSHCNTGMVTRSGDRLHFRVDPVSPSPQGWCSSDYNYRAEIRDAPGTVSHAVGTEQWWGFDYRFEGGYVPDELPWIMWQTHGDFRSPSSPMTSLQVSPTDMAGNNNARGEILVRNNGYDDDNPKSTPTGVVPRAGQTLRIVIHMVWGDGNTGRFRVWIDGAKVYDQRERTVYAEQPEGGYWKVGIYKWRWKDGANVSKSAALGIRELRTSVGTMRTITRRPGDADYGKDSYSLVVPD